MGRSSALAALLVLAGCAQVLGLDTPGLAAGNGTVTIGGTVTGLSGAGLVLEDNGRDDKLITSDGPFVFASPVPIGGSYAVTVAAEPTNPSQTCSVANGAGIASADVGDVQVTCALAAYRVGGIVLGLTGGMGQVGLANGADRVTSNGSFTFPTQVASGASFDVAITTQPQNATCAVFGGTGVIGDADVTTVVVDCSATSFTIGGTVTGLTGTVMLNDLPGASVSVTSNGTYAFPVIVAGGTPYNVTVKAQPSYPPAAQTCAVSNASGSVNGNVVDVNVTCTTNSFTVGGNAFGVSGTAVLQDNGGDDLDVKSGPFTFVTAVASGKTYAVTIKTQPATQTCSIANGSGLVTSGAISNVVLACGDPGILCGATYCTPPLQVCCNPAGTATCGTSCSGVRQECDDAADCPTGHVCCASANGGHNQVVGVSCVASCSADTLCDPDVAGACPPNQICKPYSLLTGDYSCQ